MQIDKKVVIVLPALDPDDKMSEFISNLHENLGESLELVVINDGSKAEKKVKYFDVFEQLPYCKVLTHEKNLGKGAALKMPLSIF
jgi:glycosyltransferase involved in cell wall biosynthesis